MQNRAEREQFLKNYKGSKHDEEQEASAERGFIHSQQNAPFRTHSGAQIALSGLSMIFDFSFHNAFYAIRHQHHRFLAYVVFAKCAQVLPLIFSENRV